MYKLHISTTRYIETKLVKETTYLPVKPKEVNNDNVRFGVNCKCECRGTRVYPL